MDKVIGFILLYFLNGHRGPFEAEKILKIGPKTPFFLKQK